MIAKPTLPFATPAVVFTDGTLLPEEGTFTQVDGDLRGIEAILHRIG